MHFSTAFEQDSGLCWPHSEANLFLAAAAPKGRNRMPHDLDVKLCLGMCPYMPGHIAMPLTVIVATSYYDEHISNKHTLSFNLE